MTGPDRRRLVLVASQEIAADPQAQGTVRTGTGYFISRNLVLTAFHVVSSDREASINVRAEQGEPAWREQCRIVWKDEILDAALIRVDTPLSADVPDVTWGDELPVDNVTWTSTAYPAAAIRQAGDAHDYKTAGLQGCLYVDGGRGQGRPELDLGVDDPPPQKYWQGASGAPVFVGEQLVGLINSSGWDGRRFHGTTALALRQNAAFRLETEPPWIELPAGGDWVLALTSESGGRYFAETIAGSLQRHRQSFAKRTNKQLSEKNILEIRVADALETPGRWLQLVEAICRAPFMVVDVTGFEPGIMLSLGVRAVVRRGVTVASTADELSDATLATLPFNIQEIKLLSHGKSSGSPIEHDSRHPLNTIATTLLRGTLELDTNPNYLDLPAYDAVRCANPSSGLDAPPSTLVLCSFQADYAEHWSSLLDALARNDPTGRPLRMRDMESPRLVGPTLYEQIRWTKLCVIDWTQWRPNVFFEFGVRLACSRSDPVLLLDEADAVADSSQKQKLVSLFGPARYYADDPVPAIRQAVAAYRNDERTAVEQRELLPRAQTRVPYRGTYNVALSKFDFRQESAIRSPHDFLRRLNKATFGADRQRTADSSVLFAGNDDFSARLMHSSRERWIAAWLYLRNRNGDQALGDDHKLLAELAQLGEEVLQELKDVIGDPFVDKLREDVLAVVELEARRQRGSEQPDVVKQVQFFKIQAKNRRDMRLWPRARALMEEAIALLADEYDDSGELPVWSAEVAHELADCWGLVGGIERRWALESAAGSASRRDHIDRAIEAYDQGYRYEQTRSGATETYNRLNRLIVRVLRDPRVLLAAPDAKAPLSIFINVRQELEVLADEAGVRGVDNPWDALDLALLNVLLGRQNAPTAYAAFEAMAAPDFARQSALDVIASLAELDLPTAAELRRAEERLQRPAG